jgi:molybdate transport system substrate-binding protein
VALWLALSGVPAACIASEAPAPAAPAPTAAAVTVFAAASLADVMQQLADEYHKSSAGAVTVAFASSAVLARQIEAGARADLFICADRAWMDYLQTRALLQDASRVDLAGNRLVLIAPADSALQLRVDRGVPLAAALQGGRLATGDPDAVPLGRYARAALIQLGQWQNLADRLVRAEDARAALAFVARGEAPLGIVYATDAAHEPRVRVLDTFPQDASAPIAYPAALLKGAAPAAAGFLEFLRSPAARARLRAYGFTTP